MELPGPLLAMLFEEEDQLPQQMALAESVQAFAEIEVTGEEVVHQPTGELGNNPDSLNGDGAAFDLDAEEGQQRCGQHHGGK